MTRSKDDSYQRPDGGYGWFIVFAIFLCLACVNGVQKANGLYFVYLMNQYNASNAAISTVTFVQKIAEIATALIWSILAERYGSRILVFCGAFLVTTGFVLSAFSSSILLLTLSYGLICGISFPMIVFPALQMLPRYFDKRLVLASALIFCGQSAGSILVPYVVSIAVLNYGVSGSFIIVAAIHLHIFIAAALLRPHQPSDASCSPELPSVQAGTDYFLSKPPRKYSFAKRSESHPVGPSHQSLTTPDRPATSSKWRRKRSVSRTISEAVHIWDEPPRARNLSVACLSIGSPAPAPPVAPTTPHVYDAEVSVVQERSDIGVLRLILSKYKDLAGNRLCLLLGLSTFLHSFTMSTFGTFQQAYLKDIGYGDDGKQMLVILVSSFVELISRLLFGFLIGRSWLKSYQWNQIACVLIAATLVSYPFITSYPLIVAYNSFVVCIFSICVVTIMPNFSEFLGIELAPIGQGLMVIPNGLGMVSVQIGGSLRDALGNFNAAFYMAAGALVVSAINFQLLHWLSRHRRVEDVSPSNGIRHTVQSDVITEEDRAFTDAVIESLQNGAYDSDDSLEIA